MNRTVHRLIRAPTFIDERKTRTASLVNSVFWVVLLCAFLFLIPASGFSTESKGIIELTSSAAIATMMVIKVLMHRGYVRGAGILLAVTTWVSFTIPIFAFDGIRDAAVTGYFIVIAMTGLMLGSRFLFVFTALTFLAVSGAYIAETMGIINGSMGSLPIPLDLVVVLITLGVTALLTGVSMNLITVMYERARRNEGAVIETNRELQKALVDVKTLSGLLPLCSYCKKIRDDKGYWNQIEAYIEKNSEADISHSICPECAKIYYPDMDIYDD